MKTWQIDPSEFDLITTDTRQPVLALHGIAGTGSQSGESHLESD